MSAIKFQHVFVALLVLSFSSAFFIPAKYTTRVQPQVQSLFLPVARPVRLVAGWVSGRIVRPETLDTRDAGVLAEENDALRLELVAMMQTIAELQKRDAERGLVGRIREFCTPVGVVGADPGAGREALLLNGSSLQGLKENQVALYGGSIAGIIETPPGLAGAQLRLITDNGFRVGAFFGRTGTNADGKVTFQRLESMPPALIEGVGGGAMRCATDVTMDDVHASGLQAGDWVVVEEADWDSRLQGRRLGKVVRVAPRTTAPLYADIRIEPTTNLLRLREVMVLTK